MTDTTAAGSAGSNKSAVESFLTPEAMLTPGVAGAVTMAITNSLGASFEMSSQGAAMTGLAMSFMLGLLILASNKPLLTKMVYYVANSLIIFTVASGANGLGLTHQKISLGIVSAANAQEAPSLSNQDARAAYQKVSAEYDQLSRTLEDAIRTSAPPARILELNAQRDLLDKKRHDLLAQLVKDETGVSVKQLTDPAHKQAPKDQFFRPWKF